MQKPVRRRLPADVPPAYEIDQRRRNSEVQIPLYAPQPWENPARNDRRHDEIVIDLN